MQQIISRAWRARGHDRCDIFMSLKTALTPSAQQTLAKAIYHAMHTGGGPCTGLPWRWGYELPRCAGMVE